MVDGNVVAAKVGFVARRLGALERFEAEMHASIEVGNAINMPLVVIRL